MSVIGRQAFPAIPTMFNLTIFRTCRLHCSFQCKMFSFSHPFCNSTSAVRLITPAVFVVYSD